MERTYSQQTAESVLETIHKLNDAVCLAKIFKCNVCTIYLLLFFLIGSVIRLWDLERRIVGATTDQGSNYKKAMSMYEDISEVNWIPCASYKIQLCINKALDKTPDAQALIDRCYKISTFYRGGGFSTDLLMKHQRRLYDKSFKLLSMNATRWNSRYTMAARVLRVLGAIVECHKELERTNHLNGAAGKATLDSLPLTKDHIDTLQEITDFLKPATESTRWAGNLASPTISLMYPRIHSMLPPRKRFQPELSGTSTTICPSSSRMRDRLNRCPKLCFLPSSSIKRSRRIRYSGRELIPMAKPSSPSPRRSQPKSCLSSWTWSTKPR